MGCHTQIAAEADRVEASSLFTRHRGAESDQAGQHLELFALGYVSSDIAAILNVDPKTVTNVGNAYTEEGLDCALVDDERSGRPIDFDDRERSRIVAMVCSTPPKGFYRWTLDLIVEEAQKRELVDGTISRETIRVILKEHDLKPWQEKMWCIGDIDEEYIRRMEDVLDC